MFFFPKKSFLITGLFFKRKAINCILRFNKKNVDARFNPSNKSESYICMLCAQQ